MKHYRERFLLLLVGCLVLLGSNVYVGQGRRTARAKVRDEVILHATGQGNPSLKLSDGRALGAWYAGCVASKQAIAAGTAQPLALTSADYDEDGIPDLLVGYGAPDSLVLHRGNADAIYPHSPEAQQRRAQGTYTDAPFLAPARIFKLPVAPDFLGAGDFDGDGHQDVLLAGRGKRILALLPGDGEGNFGAPQMLPLPDGVTALTVGDVNRRDGLNDVVVGIAGAAGAQTLVFEGPEGALRAEPEVFDLPAPATAVAVGQLDDTHPMDIAIAAGNHLLVVQGRDRMRSLDMERQAQVPPAIVEQHSLPDTIASLALGNFVTDVYPLEVALLTTGGSVHILNAATAKESAQYAISDRELVASEGTPTLFRANISTLPTDDLLILDPGSRAFHVVNVAHSQVLPLDYLKGTATPVAAAPMRLNGDALNDLVLLTEDGPAISITAATSTFLVNSTGTEGDPNLGDGLCDICYDPLAEPPVAPCNICTLRAAVSEANASTGLDTINFNIPGAGPHSIAGFYHVTESVTIDGTTQPGYAGTPVIEVHSGEMGFLLSGGDSLIRGFVINNAGEDAEDHGIQLDTYGNNIIEGNYIGTDTTGTTARPNASVGVDVFGVADNTIGGTTDAACNLLSGNGAHGVQISGAAATMNRVIGNYIGTDAAGTGALGNQQHGVLIYEGSNNDIGGLETGERNVIAASQLGYGVAIAQASASGNLVSGNIIGSGKNGTANLGHGRDGVAIVSGAHDNTIGGTGGSATGNTIVHNARSGVYVGTFTPMSVTGADEEAAPGAPARERAHLLLDALSMDDTSWDVAPSTSPHAPTGLDNNLIQGNSIGTNAAGTASQGNMYAGVFLFESANNTVGGSVAGAGNHIAYNHNHGIITESFNEIGNLVHGHNMLVNNAGNGIHSESESVYIQGTGNEVHDNGGWGIWSYVNVEIADGAVGNVHHNGMGGIYANNIAKLPTMGFSVEANNGPGLIVMSEFAGDTDILELTNVTIRRNAGEGLGGLGMMKLLGDTVIVNNGGDGIHNEWGQITIAGSANEIHDNGGWGIWNYGPVEIQPGALPSVNDNGKGGLWTAGTIKVPAGLVVQDNGGPGIVSVGDDAGYAEQLKLTNVTVRRNAGVGVSTLLYPISLLGGTEIANNGRDGIRSENAPIFCQGTSNRIHNNGGWGIFAPGGAVEIQGGTQVNQNTIGGIVSTNLLITGNGNQVSGNHGVGLRAGAGGEVRLHNLTVANNAHHGIMVTDGGVEGRRLIVNGNSGTGIVVVHSALNLSASQVANNNGWGLIAQGSTYNLQQVKISQNRLGGIYHTPPLAAQARLFAVGNAATATVVASMIDANQGDGVRYEGGGGVTIVESNLLVNSGYGVNNTSSSTLTIQDNWWGDTTGPGGAGPGTGDEVKGSATFTPWRTQAVVLVATPSEDPVHVARGATSANLVHVQDWIAATSAVRVTLSDTQGWLTGPTDFTVSLAEGIGASFPISHTVPAGAIPGTSSDVTVNVTSQSDSATSASVTFQVVASLVSDLAIAKGSTPNVVMVGDDVTYTLAISNHGPDTATGVTVTDSLPAGMSFQAATTSQGSCGEQASRVSCTLGTLNSGGQATVTIRATPTTVGILANTASVAGNEHDPDTVNNVNVASTAINLADLAITKVALVEPVQAGSPLTYTMITSNGGPVTATGVTISDTLPVGTVFDSAVITSGSCAEAAGIVSCESGSLAPGEAVTTTLIVTPMAGGVITNTASVAGNEADYTYSNLATVTTTVLGGPVTNARTLYLPLVMQEWPGPTWHTQKVDARRMFEDVTHRSLAIDSQGRPHVAFGYQELYHAWHDGNAWQFEVVDAGPWVGRWAALALDSNDSPHISYYDWENTCLKYAHWDGATWQIASPDCAGNVGWDTTIVVDGSDRPHISYTKAVGFSQQDLRYAHWDGAQWLIETIEAGSNSRVGGDSSLALDSTGRPHVSYNDSGPGAEPYRLKHAVRDGGTWITETLESGGFVGSNALAIDDTGNIHLVYGQSETQNHLKHAYWNGTSWQVTPLLTQNDELDGISLVLDGSQRPVFSYYHDTGSARDVRYMRWDGAQWQSEIVEANLEGVNWFEETSLALDSSGEPHIAYYLEDFTWLGYAHKTGGNWQTGEIDTGGITGVYASLALDGSDRPHIAYYEERAKDLLYAAWDGTSWQISTVDTGGGEANDGSVSLAVDSAGRPHISYRDTALDISIGEDGLKYATWDGAQWQTQYVDQEGIAGRGSSIALDSTGRPHISYYDVEYVGSGQDSMRYASWDGASWQIQTVDLVNQVYLESPAALTLDSADRPHIAYLDGTNKDLKYARWDGAQWQITTVDSAGDVGSYPSLALDSAGHAHISYRDLTNDDLKYAQWDGAQWQIATVASAGDVGYYTSLALDSIGSPHITYYDNTNRDLKYAQWTGTMWQIATVRTGYQVGYYTSLELDSAGQPHVAYQHRSEGDLEYAWFGH